jgi:hypothetical protein
MGSKAFLRDLGFVSFGRLWEVGMFGRILDTLFGCWHQHYSFPITVRGSQRSPAAATTGTYVVCLDCGKELAYDWKTMKIVQAPEASHAAVHALATKEAA